MEITGEGEVTSELQDNILGGGGVKEGKGGRGYGGGVMDQDCEWFRGKNS